MEQSVSDVSALFMIGGVDADDPSCAGLCRSRAGARGVRVAVGLGRASALLEHSVVYPTSKPGPQLAERRLDVVHRQMMLLLHHLWEVEAQPARVLLGQRGDDQSGVARVLPKLLAMASTGDSAPILVATRLTPAWLNASRPSACRCSAASCSVAV